MKANWDSFFIKRYGKGGFLFSDMIQSATEEAADMRRHADATEFFREHPGASDSLCVCVSDCGGGGRCSTFGGEGDRTGVGGYCAERVVARA
jgi:hypothetical protein